MTVPKRRHSASRQGKRRANWKLKNINVVLCSVCREPVLSHRACPSCGSYKGRGVLKIESKKEKRSGKKKEAKKES